MKSQKIGIYHLYENDENIIVRFKDVLGKTKVVKIDFEVKEELKKQKKENKAFKNEYDRHIEHIKLSEEQLNKRAFHKPPELEDIFFCNEGELKIKREIWNLPSPQNRRVYMRVVDRLTLTEIAKIEQRSIPAIKRSVDRGIITLQKKLKKFYFEG